MKANQYKLVPPFSWIISLFKNLTAMFMAIEETLVEFLVAVGPWVAPLTPAYMTYKHVTDVLNFDVTFAISTAFSVEILGLASGHTLARLYQHNKGQRAKMNKISTTPVWATFSAYIFVLLILNVGLDIGDKTSKELLASTGLVLLTIPAVVIVSARSQFREIITGLSVPILTDERKSVFGTRSEQKRNVPTKRKRRSGTREAYLFLQAKKDLYKTPDDVPQAREISRLLDGKDIAASSAQTARNKFISEVFGR